MIPPCNRGVGRHSSANSGLVRVMQQRVRVMQQRVVLMREKRLWLSLNVTPPFSINIEITLLITAVVVATYPISLLHPRTST
jgi:hypothetical protein